MKSRDTRSAQDLKREVLSDLNRVNRDMDRLQSRMTPGQMIDDAIFYSQGSSPAAVFDHLKRNPMGTTLLAFGTFLLMENDQHQSFESILKHTTKDAYELTKNKASEVAFELRDKVNQVKDQMHEKVDRYRRRKDAQAAFGEGTDLMDELNAVTFVAIGVGLGALSGATFPVSDQEREFVHRNLGTQLSHLTNEIEDALNESARILKEMFLSELKNVDVDIFKSTPGRI